MKTMKKRAIAFLAVLLMLFSCIPAGSITVTGAAEDVTLKLHYHRPDGSYDDWAVWMWADGMDGADYSFAEEDGEMVATAVIGPSITSVGFIVHTPDWGKDVDADQFIDIAEMVSGTVHVYVESGVAGYTKEYSDDAVTGERQASAEEPGVAADAPSVTGDVTLKLHYDRPDGSYDDWAVWMWADGMDGADYSFAEEDGEMVATAVIGQSIISVGFIVHTPDWGKDIDADQFIDIAEMLSGTVHIYVESGVEGYTKEYGDDAVTGERQASEEEPSVAVDAPSVTGDVTLKLHYNRPDGSYDDWAVWMWADGMDGADYSFAEEDGEMVATMSVAPGVTSVGFIVRTPDWGKDVDADQFIDIAEMLSGTVHIYVESGVEGYTKEYGDDAVTGERQPSEAEEETSGDTTSSAEDVVLKLHYHRPDGSYDNWAVWMWAAGMDGADYTFAEENGEMVATLIVAPGVTSIGFIVRTPDWGKDVDADQFIDIAEMVAGTVHIYVESGVAGYTKEYADDVVIGIKLYSARYDGDTTITALFTGKIEEDLDSYFTLTGPDGTIALEKVEAVSDTEYHLILKEKIDPSKAYTLTCDGSDLNVVMPIVFSMPEFEAEYTYNGDDLGATYTKDKTSFRVWAPTADAVYLNLYSGGTAGVSDLIEQIEMTPDDNGTWVTEKSGDLNGTYYTYRVEIGGKANEACDPYARTTGLNGNRAMVIDLASTNPEGWEQDSDPNAGKNFNDAIIYELHIRDLSTSSDSGITNKGKFLGLTETGTKSPSGVATGLDHIKELGVTHVHLLPIYDFGSVDEGNAYAEQFNWGYDPVNYNVPEGSYSTDPSHGEVRVKEMKQMVQALHSNGISVIMDVVYNHVQSASDFCFNKIVPNYFTRIAEDGTYSNGSGCGNDTASERSMVKKYIVDSVKYWADEYHIDGFRFDLVGLLDTDLVNTIVEEVHKDHPNVVFYGEGWTLSTNVTKDGYTLATQANSTQTPGFAYFSDTIRDLLKGSVFNEETGYVSGAQGLEATLEKCFMGLSPDWCTTPAQSINYASCHDNMTLIDRITVSTPNASRADQIKMNNLAAAIYMTSEGIPFMQAGEEMLRTKVKADGSYDSNSYSSGDKVNQLRWEDLANDEYKQVFEYYKGLIAFRKEHGALRLTTAADVRSNVIPVNGMSSNVVAFRINGGLNGETAEALYVIFNANAEAVEIDLPEGVWNVYINGEKAGTEILQTIKDGKVSVDGISAMVLALDSTQAEDSNSNSSSGSSPVLLIVIIIIVVIAAAVAGFVIVGKKKGKGTK